MEIKKVVIPVAGKGTRFLPATKIIPKELIPLIDTPMVGYVFEEAVNSGLEEIIFVISRGKESIVQFFKENKELESFLSEKGKEKELDLCRKFQRPVKISTVIQEEQLGLGHAILCAERLIKEGESFGVILGDDIILSKEPVIKQLVEVSGRNNDKSVIGVMEVPKEETSKYGIVKGEYLEDDSKTLRMSEMVEKPSPAEAPSNLATPGRYILNSEIFKHLKTIPRGSGGEYQLTDALAQLAKADKVYAHIFEGDRFDTGNVGGFLEATVEFALRNEKTRNIMKDIIREKAESYDINLQ